MPTRITRVLVEFACAYAAFQALDLLVHGLHLGRAPFPPMSAIVFITATMVAVAGAGAHLNSRYILVLAALVTLINALAFLITASLFAPALLNSWQITYQSVGRFVIALIILGGAMMLARRQRA